jgi:HlyD family secretion protein
MQLRRWIVIIGISATVVAAIVWGFMPKTLIVDTAKVETKPLKVTVEEEGRTRVKDRFTVSAPVAGYMKRIHANVGDRVQSGQMMVVIEPMRSTPLDPRSRATAEAAVWSAEAYVKTEEQRMKAARADAEYSEKNLERSRKLFESGLISRDAIEQVEAGAKRAGAVLLASEGAVKVARAEVERAKAALNQSGLESINGKTLALRSPATGSILRIYRTSEGSVQPGEPLIDVGDPRSLEVKIEVLSTDAIRIKEGSTVVFDRWGGQTPLTGTVRTIEPAGFTKISSLGVEEQRVLIIVDLNKTDEGAKRLGDGFRLEATFTLWEGNDVLQVPAPALFRKQDGWAVFVMKNGRAHLREVKVGHRTGLAAQILSGLSAGETIISRPENAINEGTRVKARQ